MSTYKVTISCEVTTSKDATWLRSKLVAQAIALGDECSEDPRHIRSMIEEVVQLNPYSNAAWNAHIKRQQQEGV